MAQFQVWESSGRRERASGLPVGEIADSGRQRSARGDFEGDPRGLVLCVPA